jgi:HK97 family phage major capsid protein
MLKLKDVEARLGTVETEMRTIYDGAETAGENDLTGEKLEKWTTLKTERADLKAKQTRAKERDELDRKDPGRSVTEKRADDAWGLTREQRMADYVKRTTGADCEGLSLGRGIAAHLTGNWRGAEAEHRVMGSTIGSTGGFFVPDPVSANVIDLVRNVSVLSAAGAPTGRRT